MPNKSSSSGLLILLFACGGFAWGVEPDNKFSGGEWSTRGDIGTFEFLINGEFSNSGANLLLSRDGRLGPIHAWDYNGDGYADIIFNNSHDHAFEIPARIFVNETGVPDTENPVELPASGGKSVTVADLNGSGWNDLIVVNGNNNTTGYQDSFIYWGGTEGWSAGNRTGLLTLRGDHATVADLNGNGHLDIFFGNRGDKPGHDRESFIYWGNGVDFTPARRTSLRTNYAAASVAADVNGDGFMDLIIGNRGHADDDGSLEIFWGAEDGFRNYRRSIIGSQRVRDLALHDVTGNGHPDLIVADMRLEANAQTGIFPGTSSGLDTDGFVPLPIAGATAVAVGDFDGDGNPEIAVAHEILNVDKRSTVEIFKRTGDGAWSSVQSLEAFGAVALDAGDVNANGFDDLLVAEQWDRESKSRMSRLYLGGKDGLQPARAVAYPTDGASDAILADATGNGRLDVIFSNWSTGRSYGDIDSYVYWGGHEGNYSVENRTDLPTLGGYQSVMTDFDGDGYVDVLLVTSGEDDYHDFLQRGSFIYHGGPNGLSPERRTELPPGARGFGATVADLNRDGWLDIVLGDGFGEATRIYYGSEEGFTDDNLRVLQCGGSMFLRVADLNGNGMLDIITPRISQNKIVIFWNSLEGFHEEDITEIPMSGPSVVEFADLNNNGWLDMIACGFWDGISSDQRTPTAIYWGGPNGYSTYNRTLLMLSGVTDASVADLNKNGHLDIVFSSYHGNTRRDIDSYIYWGNGEDFSDDNRTPLPTDSASGNLIMDLNEDGWLDIVFSNHNKNNDHHVDSIIYWGSPEGFSVENTTRLPAIGPHQMADVDAGDLKTRALAEEYVSPPVEFETPITDFALAWTAHAPRGSGIRADVRAADSSQSLADAEWRPVENGEPASPPTATTALQFRFRFESKTGASQASIRDLKLHAR